MSEIPKPNPCKKPVIVTTDGPKYSAKCYGTNGIDCCEWIKTQIIPETGINMGALQREHDGDW